MADLFSIKHFDESSNSKDNILQTTVMASGNGNNSTLICPYNDCKKRIQIDELEEHLRLSSKFSQHFLYQCLNSSGNLLSIDRFWI